MLTIMQHIHMTIFDAVKYLTSTVITFDWLLRCYLLSCIVLIMCYVECQ